MYKMLNSISERKIPNSKSSPVHGWKRTYTDATVWCSESFSATGRKIWGATGFFFKSLLRLGNVLFLLMLLAVFSAPTAQAQGTRPGNFQQMLLELDQKIATLEKISSQFHNQQLVQSIQTIKSHRREALEYFRKRQYHLAEQELGLAIKLSNAVLKKSTNVIVQNYQVPLEEMRRRAENQIHQHYNADADRLLKRAKQVHKDAVEAFKVGNYSKASGLYKVEKSLLENCLKILEQSTPEKYAGLQSERENFLELKHQAEKSLRSSRATLATSLYNQAIDQARKADQASKKGDLKKANLYYQWSTRLLLRVINLTEGGSYALSQQARDNLQLTQQAYNGTVQEYSAQMNPLTRKLLQQVQKLLGDARIDFNQRKYSSAIQKADVARKILSRLQSNPIRKNESYQLQLVENSRALRQTLEEIKKSADRNGTGGTLIKLSEEFLKRSQRELTNRNYKVSAAYLLIANRLAIQFKRVNSRATATSSVSEASVQEKYKSFQAKMDQLKRRDFSHDFAKQHLVKSLRELQGKIRLGLQTQNWTEANQYLIVAESILRLL